MKKSASLVLALAWTASSTYAQSCFESELLPVLGDIPTRVALGDFEGDGDLDIATFESLSYGYTLRANQGGASWGPGSQLSDGVGLQHFALLDVDGDGDADLARCDMFGALSVRPSLGPAGFGSGGAFELLPGSVNHFAGADLDNDGDLDLAVAGSGGGQNPGQVLVLFNHGTWDLVPGPGVIDDGRRVAIGDFDADGDGDLAILRWNGNAVHVAWNDGQGGFPGVPTTIPLGGTPVDLVARDFDGDGRTDVAVAQANARVSILLGAPGGFAPYVEYPTPHAITQIAAGDFDADGDADLAVVGNGTDVSILGGAGNGTFQLASTIVVGPSTYALDAGDVDADGDVDLAFAVGHADAARVLRSCAVAGAPMCFGDGSATACPCGNASPVGARAGCLHSLGASGTLRASGVPRISADSIVLHGASMPSAPALYFQGTSATNAGLGSVFGDGLRCAGGSVARIGTAMNAGGASQYPGVGQPPVSVIGGVTVPGERHYQVWYRNAASFCTPATFNLTNSLRLTWRP